MITGSCEGRNEYIAKIGQNPGWHICFCNFGCIICMGTLFVPCPLGHAWLFKLSRTAVLFSVYPGLWPRFSEGGLHVCMMCMYD